MYKNLTRFTASEEPQLSWSLAHVIIFPLVGTSNFKKWGHFWKVWGPISTSWHPLMASMMQTGYGTGSRVGPWVHKQCHNKKIGSHYYRMRELQLHSIHSERWSNFWNPTPTKEWITHLAGGPWQRGIHKLKPKVQVDNKRTIIFWWQGFTTAHCSSQSFIIHSPAHHIFW